jgi:hypothetical protein
VYTTCEAGKRRSVNYTCALTRLAEAVAVGEARPGSLLPLLLSAVSIASAARTALAR